MDYMQIICNLHQTDNHASTSSLNFYKPDGSSSWRPTNSVKALKTISAEKQPLNQSWWGDEMVTVNSISMIDW